MTATTALTPSSVVMRAARGSDGDALARLAALDSKRALADRLRLRPAPRARAA